MVMALGNDFSPKGGLSGDVDLSIILEKSTFMEYPSLIVEGCGNALIP